MKCLGLIGGDGLGATLSYHRQLMEEIQHRWGEHCAANLVSFGLHTPEFALLIDQGRKHQLAKLLSTVAGHLRALGAEAIVLCSPSLHICADRIGARIPIIHMVDPTIDALRRARVNRLGIIGLRHNDEERMWRESCRRAHIIDVLMPVPRDREKIAYIIQEELQRGIVRDSSRAALVGIIHTLRQAGARALVLASPELDLALLEAAPILPVYKASELHVLAALDWASHAKEAAPASA